MKKATTKTLLIVLHHLIRKPSFEPFSVLIFSQNASRLPCFGSILEENGSVATETLDNTGADCVPDCPGQLDHYTLTPLTAMKWQVVFPAAVLANFHRNISVFLFPVE